MTSLARKVQLRRQAQSAKGTADKVAAVSRTGQVARTTVPVGEDDLPVVEVAADARTASETLPVLEDSTTLAGDDAWDAWETAGTANSAAADALAAADQAAIDAAAAKTTADGRNRIYVQQVQPVTMPEVPFVAGDLWYRTDTSGRIAEVRVWNGTEWAAYQMVAGSLLVPGSVGPTLISDGGVTTQKLAADAIDGMVVTGALMRTAASGQRLQFDSFGLRAFGALGNETASLDAAGGGLRLTGSMNLGTELDENGSYPNIAGRGANFFSRFGAGSAQLIRYAGIGQGSIFQSERDLSNREGSFAVVTTPTQTTLTMDARDLDDPYPHRAASISRNIDKTMWVKNPEGPIYIAATSSEDGTGKPADPSIWLVPQAFPTKGRIELRGDVSFDGDTDWANVALIGGTNGWETQNGQTPMWRVRMGWLQIKGRFGRVGGGSLPTSFTTFSLANSTIADLVNAAGLANSPKSTPGAGTNTEGLLRILSDGSMQCAAPSGSVAFFPNVEFLL